MTRLMTYGSQSGGSVVYKINNTLIRIDIVAEGHWSSAYLTEIDDKPKQTELIKEVKPTFMQRFFYRGGK